MEPECRYVLAVLVSSFVQSCGASVSCDSDRTIVSRLQRCSSGRRRFVWQSWRQRLVSRAVSDLIEDQAAQLSYLSRSAQHQSARVYSDSD